MDVSGLLHDDKWTVGLKLILYYQVLYKIWGSISTMRSTFLLFTYSCKHRWYSHKSEVLISSGPGLHFNPLPYKYFLLLENISFHISISTLIPAGESYCCVYRTLAQSSKWEACLICVVGQISSGEGADQKELTVHKTHLWVGWKFSGARPALQVVRTESSARSKDQLSGASLLKTKYVSQPSGLMLVLAAITAEPLRRAAAFLRCYLLDVCWFQLFCTVFTTYDGGDYILPFACMLLHTNTSKS